MAARLKKKGDHCGVGQQGRLLGERASHRARERADLSEAREKGMELWNHVGKTWTQVFFIQRITKAFLDPLPEPLGYPAFVVRGLGPYQVVQVTCANNVMYGDTWFASAGPILYQGDLWGGGGGLNTY